MPFARTKDRATSHEAAQSVTNVTATQQAILNALVLPMSDEALIGWLRHTGLVVSESGVRSRRAELVAYGLVKSVGVTKSISGRSMNVWAKA